MMKQMFCFRGRRKFGQKGALKEMAGDVYGTF